MAESKLANGLRVVAISDHAEMVSRRIARTWSVTAVILLALLGYTVGIPHGPDGEHWEQLIQLGTISLLSLGVLIAFRREGLGGAVLLLGSAALWGLAALQDEPATAFLPAVLFLVPAIGFLIAWSRTKTIASLVVMATAVTMTLVVGGAAATVLHDHGYGAAHPQSDLPELPEGPVMWVWSGAVGVDTATVVTRVPDGGSVTLDVAPAGGTTFESAGRRDGDVWRFDLTGLSPGTAHTYVVRIDGATVADRAGMFTTYEAGPMSFTVAAASCARLGSNGLVYESIANLAPDLFIVTGDFFYADYVETAAHYEHAYESTLTQPAQAALYSSVPIAYVWDDHDYGRNNADRTMRYRELALDAYSTNVPHYPLVAPDAVHHSFAIGRVQFVLLDERSHRDPADEDDGPGKSMLGETQLDWLQDRLLAGRDQYALTIVVSQVPWVGASDPGADHWAGYSFERSVISEFIATNEIDNILMLAGDAHMVAIDDGSNTNYSTMGGPGFPILQAAALDRPGSIKGGPYSEGVHAGGGQFGIIEVADDGGQEIRVRLSGVDWTGEIHVQYTYTVGAT